MAYGTDDIRDAEWDLDWEPDPDVELETDEGEDD